MNGQQPKPQPTPVKQTDPVVESLTAQKNVPQPQQQELPPMLQQLYLLIMDNKVDMYGQLFDVLMTSEETAAMIMAIQKKELDGEMLTAELKKTGFPVLQDAGFVIQSKRYLGGFVNWVIENTIGKAHALCQNCATEHIFENRYEFSKVKPICGLDQSATEQCQGLLILVSDARQEVNNVA